MYSQDVIWALLPESHPTKVKFRELVRSQQEATKKLTDDVATEQARKELKPDTADTYMRMLGTAARRGLLGRSTLASSFLKGPSGAAARVGV